MVFSFLIATLIMFSSNIILNVISLGMGLKEKEDGILLSSVIIFIYLVLVTWNIFAIYSL